MLFVKSKGFGEGGRRKWKLRLFWVGVDLTLVQGFLVFSGYKIIIMYFAVLYRY